MATQWIKPKEVFQYAETGGESVHIPWDFTSISTAGILPIKLNGTLQHIARSPKPDKVEKTYYIKFSNFPFTNIPEAIQGINVRLNASRNGRITDDTVQLVSHQSIISDNAANLVVENSKIYNFPVTYNNIFNSNFGVELRFRSHPSWPHNETIVINSVEIQLY